jgi:hypothetical protein
MGRALSCAFGKQPFKTKREAEAADPQGKAKRCDHCRWWHPANVKSKRARRR